MRVNAQSARANAQKNFVDWAFIFADSGMAFVICESPFGEARFCRLSWMFANVGFGRQSGDFLYLIHNMGRREFSV